MHWALLGRLIWRRLRQVMHRRFLFLSSADVPLPAAGLTPGLAGLSCGPATLLGFGPSQCYFLPAVHGPFPARHPHLPLGERRLSIVFIE